MGQSWISAECSSTKSFVAEMRKAALRFLNGSAAYSSYYTIFVFHTALERLHLQLNA